MVAKHSSGKPIVNAASACVWRGHDVLLIQRGSELGKGRWSLPGGKLEMGETGQIAAHRELAEEAGVTADLRDHIGTFHIEASGVLYAIDCYSGDWLSGEAQASSDAAAVAWVHFEAVADWNVAPNIVEAVTRARRMRAV